MKCLLRLVPCENPHEKQKVVYAKNIYEIFHVVKDRPFQHEIELCISNDAHETVVPLSQVKQIACEYPSEGRIIYVPLNFDCYEKALKSVSKKVNIMLMDALGVRSKNNSLETSIAYIVPDDPESWDDIIQDIAEEHKILIDHRIQDYLEENYHLPKRK